MTMQTDQSMLQRLTQVAFTKRNLLFFGAFGLGCALTGYFFSGKERPPEHVPIIRAETTPYKIRPENDEQPQIPHEDKLVYNRLAPSTDQPKVERLLPGPEKPIFIEPKVEIIEEVNSIDSEEMFPLEITPAPTKPQVVVVKTPKQETFPLLPAKPTLKPRQSSPKVESTRLSIVPRRRPAGSARPVTQKMQKVVIPSRPVAKSNNRAAPVRSPQRVVPAQKARYRVQLAAMRTPTLARQEWHRLASINPELKRLKPHFVRTDLGARKGIFYRVQGGRFVTQAQAQRLCRQLKRKSPKLPCMIVPIE